MSAPRREAGTGAATVRPARREDVPRLWGLVRALAAYERLEQEVNGSPDRLDEHLFGPRPTVEGLVAERDGDLAGYALFFPLFSSFRTGTIMWLEDLFVLDSQRGQGLGRRLMAGVARRARERDCLAMAWVVLDWNEPSIGFYRSLGARPAAGWTTFVLTDEPYAALAGDGR